MGRKESNQMNKQNMTHYKPNQDLKPWLVAEAAIRSKTWIMFLLALICVDPLGMCVRGGGVSV